MTPADQIDQVFSDLVKKTSCRSMRGISASFLCRGLRNHDLNYLNYDLTYEICIAELFLLRMKFDAETGLLSKIYPYLLLPYHDHDHDPHWHIDPVDKIAAPALIEVPNSWQYRLNGSHSRISHQELEELVPAEPPVPPIISPAQYLDNLFNQLSRDIEDSYGSNALCPLLYDNGLEYDANTKTFNFGLSLPSLLSLDFSFHEQTAVLKSINLYVRQPNTDHTDSATDPHWLVEPVNLPA